jgi:hypothetical protein
MVRLEHKMMRPFLKVEVIPALPDLEVWVEREEEEEGGSGLSWTRVHSLNLYNGETLPLRSVDGGGGRVQPLLDLAHSLSLYNGETLPLRSVAGGAGVRPLLDQGPLSQTLQQRDASTQVS